MSTTITHPQRTMPSPTIPQATAAILFALAKANNKTIETLFAEFCEAMADDAGRREGSWEAESVNRFRAAYAPRCPVYCLSVLLPSGGWATGFLRGERLAWPVVRLRGSYRIGR